jgi:hypothetical protein
VTQLYLQALGFLFVASYDKQSYGGGLRTRLHAGLNCSSAGILLLLTPSHGPRRKRRF